MISEKRLNWLTISLSLPLVVMWWCDNRFLKDLQFARAATEPNKSPWAPLQVKALIYLSLEAGSETKSYTNDEYYRDP